LLQLRATVPFFGQLEWKPLLRGRGAPFKRQKSIQKKRLKIKRGKRKNGLGENLATERSGGRFETVRQLGCSVGTETYV